MKGMMWELAIAFGTMIFLTMLWTILTYPLSSIVTTFKTITPVSFMNETVNKTLVEGEFDLAYNSMYFSLFIIILILFVFVVKVAVQYQRREGLYGG